MNRFLSTLLLVFMSISALAKEYVTYYFNDAQGTPIAATNEAGEIVWKKEHTPYGEAYGNTDDKANRIGYTGHVEEEQFGLVYMQQRWYCPMCARFMSIDPIDPDVVKNPMSFNRYIYANDNPYKYVDPDGREVTININRQTYTNNSIISTLSVTSDKTPASFSGYALEPVVAGKFGMKMPIPEGTYGASVRTDHNPDRIQLEGVQSYSKIQVHNGTDIDDTVGCFVAGRAKVEDRVIGSKSAMSDINNVVQQDGSGKINVNVTGTNQNPALGSKKDDK